MYLKRPYSSIIKNIDLLKKKIDKLRPLQPEILQSLQEKLRIDWTYNSNALEGNTLTYGETAFFLREGLTSEGRPLKDYLEAKNHAEAIDLLSDIVKKTRVITEGLIKEIHALLMKGIDFTYAKGVNGQIIHKPVHPGQYKLNPNHVLTLSGNIHYYTEPIHVHDEMEKLLKWYHQQKNIHIVEKAAIFHYRFVSIHPFDDGNGRLARLLMNLILMQASYPPCVIENIYRQRYLKALELADKKRGYSPFIKFIAFNLFRTLTKIIEILLLKNNSLIMAEYKPKKAVNILEDIASVYENELSFFNHELRKKSILSLMFKKNQPLSVSQINRSLPEIKRPTLKKDLQNLVKLKKIQKKGIGKGTLYFSNPK